MTSVLVSGANGFVGQALCKALVDSGFEVRAALRRPATDAFLPGVRVVTIADIDAQTDWRDALSGIDVVVHLAARVHIMRETEVNALDAFRRVNTEGSRNLAEQAARAGVKRFIYLSTIKVLGEHSKDGCFSMESPAAPSDAYAISKWEAEQALRSCSQQSGLELVIIRPPLLYGAGVKGNFQRLMQLIRKGYPLPFASINNQRSLAYVENLCDLIKVCIRHPAAKGQTFLIADAEDLSTPELITRLAAAMNARVSLWPVPVGLLKCLGTLLGKRAEVDRLCDSLRIDASQTHRLLDWQAPYLTSEALAKTANDFINRQS